MASPRPMPPRDEDGHLADDRQNFLRQHRGRDRADMPARLHPLDDERIDAHLHQLFADAGGGGERDHLAAALLEAVDRRPLRHPAGQHHVGHFIRNAGLDQRIERRMHQDEVHAEGGQLLPPLVGRGGREAGLCPNRSPPTPTLPRKGGGEWSAGRSNSRVALISLSSSSGGHRGTGDHPERAALDSAATRCRSDTQLIAPPMMACSQPSSSAPRFQRA